MMEDTKEYKLFSMLQNEISFDVDLSNMPCGINAAIYFSATSVRHLAIDMDISFADRDQVMAFLAQGQGYGYVPQSRRTMAF